MTTSRMRSKGSMLASSRRPTARVTTRMRKKTTAARRTRSMPHLTQGRTMTVLIHARERPRLVVERDRNVLAAHGRRIDLRLEIDHQRVAGNEPIVAQDQALAAAGLPTAAGSIVFTCIPRSQ